MGGGGSRHLPVDPDVFDPIESLFLQLQLDLSQGHERRNAGLRGAKLAQDWPDARDPRDIILLLNKYYWQKKGALLRPL